MILSTKSVINRDFHIGFYLLEYCRELQTLNEDMY